MPSLPLPAQTGNLENLAPSADCRGRLALRLGVVPAVVASFDSPVQKSPTVLKKKSSPKRVGGTRSRLPTTVRPKQTRIQQEDRNLRRKSVVASSGATGLAQPQFCANAVPLEPTHCSHCSAPFQARVMHPVCRRSSPGLCRGVGSHSTQRPEIGCTNEVAQPEAAETVLGNASLAALAGNPRRSTRGPTPRRLPLQKPPPCLPTTLPPCRRPCPASLFLSLSLAAPAGTVVASAGPAYANQRSCWLPAGGSPPALAGLGVFPTATAARPPLSRLLLPPRCPSPWRKNPGQKNWAPWKSPTLPLSIDGVCGSTKRRWRKGLPEGWPGLHLCAIFLLPAVSTSEGEVVP